MAPMPSRPSPEPIIDMPRERSLSFARTGPDPTPHPDRERAPIPVGPGRPMLPARSRSGPLRDDVDGYPIQPAKVHPPALRDETLERPRLLDWLRSKTHGRVVLILADAGYGKTTLLADFARRSRTRTLWYRFDDDDRDWVTLLHHLVASGRQHHPGFAPATAALLAETGVGGPGREVVLDAFIGELPDIAAQGAVLIFDDVHLVDDAPDVRHILRELVGRAPERLSIVFASRRAPTVPLSKLRAVGEVAEIGTDDLRFDASETAQLFTETYGRRIEPDVLVDLAHRTEGWIASLQLVQAALRDRSPAEIRRFVRTLNGADHDLYDYLAEEVVGDLDTEFQRFLMDTSILQVVTPELAEVVSGREAADVARLMAAAERLTLLSRVSGGPRTHQRYHPLVREFLEARFRSMDGAEVVAALHRRTAAAVAATDWRLGAHHYREAQDTEAMLGVVASAIPTIMGNGQYALAEAFVGAIPEPERPHGFDLILSRVDMQQGDYDAAIAASQAVLDSPSSNPIQRDHALLNLVTLQFNFGNGDEALRLARALATQTEDSNLAAIAEVTSLILTASTGEDIETINRRLRAMAQTQQPHSAHHFGVSMLNLASNSVVQDRLSDALAEVREALDGFEESSGAIERASARVLLAGINLRLGKVEEARVAVAEMLTESTEFVPCEVYADAADTFDSYGSDRDAEAILDRIRDQSLQTINDRRLIAVTRARMAIRRHQLDEAAEHLAAFPPGLQTVVGLNAAVRMTRAHLAMARGDVNACAQVREATSFALAEGVDAVRRVGELLVAACGDAAALSRTIATIATTFPWHVTFVAEEIVRGLPHVDREALAIVRDIAQRHPERWRRALRQEVSSTHLASNIPAARLLEVIGTEQDIAPLRALAKRAGRRMDVANLGRALARRLAPRIVVEDQGRVTIIIGDREVPGTLVRRKVLALLCFLITRPDLSATRDQVLDALWPELDPSVATNSLNQTMYFLRRVLEENYSDDLSPEYVHHDSDVIWLDSELVTSRSVQCRLQIRAIQGRPTPEQVERLSATYRGRFALDFEYEEWAEAYRDSLHASYLEIVERAVLDDFQTGHFDRGIVVARRALDADPHAEQIEVCLLRLYRVTGAHSAAAEQYAHYASVMRDELGLEPPPLESL